MNHIIISIVLFASSFGAAYWLHIATKAWQSANQDQINDFKKEFGEKMTLYPKNHSIIQGVIGGSIVGFFLYMVTAVLLFFFA